jgi:hypothetical protein
MYTPLYLSAKELEVKATCLHNELAYLIPTIEVERSQAVKFISELRNIIENMECEGVRQSFIDMCWSTWSGSKERFAYNDWFLENQSVKIIECKPEGLYNENQKDIIFEF